MLDPGSESGPISCSLINTSLGILSKAKYRALSYTWGDPSNCQDIQINGHKFPVTVNLYYALRNLRSETSHEHLWIDAICINQKDDKERSEQVLRMRDIYSQAQCVIVWLGRDFEPEDKERNFAMFQKWDAGSSEDGDRSTRLAFDLLKKLSGAWQSSAVALTIAKKENISGNPIEPFGFIRAYLSQHEDIHISLNRRLTAEEEIPWLSLGRLCWRPWFDRVWVLQEVALAADAVVSCGNHVIPWTNLMDAVGILEIHSYSQGASDIVGPNLGAAKVWRMGVGKTYKDGAYRNADPSYELLTLLNQTKHLLATDPRDKIYGLMGLTTLSTEHEMIIPDYKKPIGDIYKGVAKFVLDNQNIDILCFCDGSINYCDLPTWAPDWTHSYPSLIPSLGATKSSLTMFSAAGEVPSISRFSEDLTTLIVTGFCVGRVSKLSKIQDAGYNDSPQFQAILDDWEAIAIPPPVDDPYRDRRAAWRQLLISDDGPGHSQRAQYAGFRVEDSGNLYEEMRSPKYQPTGEIGGYPTHLRQYIRSIKTWTQGCHLLRTEGGHIGLTIAGHKARKGDMICILLGGQMPFLIRESDDRGHQILIGRCYVQGLMSGQAMEGLGRQEAKRQEFCLK